MRILQVITELTPAGAERVVCELSKGLAAKGHYVTVVSLMPLPENDAILCEIRDAGLEVRSLNVTKFTPWRIYGIRRIIRELKPDVVHSHLIHPNIIARFAKVLMSMNFTLINTVHIAERRKSRWWHFTLDKLTFKLCDIQSCVSEAVRDFHSKKIGIPPDIMPVIYNGLPFIKPLDESRICALRKEWNVANCAKVIGSVGRLDWQKGYDIFFKQLPAISAIIPKGEVWAIVIIGEGKYRAELENIINAKKYNNLKIILNGFRPDAGECIGAFDLFIMPSRYEGHPLTLVEAMFSGIFIIASKAETIVECGKEYHNIKFINFESHNEFTTILLENVNAKKIESFKKFTIDKMVNEYGELYQKLLI